MKPIVQNMSDVECVWMRAGVINYRLCDRQFNCEACDLDRALRNSASPVKQDGSGHTFNNDGLLENNEPVAGREADYILTRHFFRVRKLFNGTCYLSLDPLVLPVFEDAVIKNLCAANRFMAIGDPVLLSSAPWGAVTITADFPFHVLGSVKTTLNPLEGNQWFAVIEPSLPLTSIEPLCERELQERLKGISAEIHQHIPDFSSLGITLNDGGKPLNRLYGVLGSSLYKKVVSLLLDNN